MKLKTALDITRCKIPGTHPAGKCLYLQVRSAPREDAPKRVTKRWVARITVRKHEGKGRTRDVGLGGIGDLTLEQARSKALELRRLARDGVDPIEDRRARLAAVAAERAKAAAQAVTFKQVTEVYIAKRLSTRAPAYVADWRSKMERYAYPILGDLPPCAIDVTHVEQVLEPIWHTHNPTARLLRANIKAVLDMAKTRKLRTGDNPAAWTANLDDLLEEPSRVHAVVHHPALPYEEIFSFLGELRSREATSARALEFVILTATRRHETVGARWEEISLADKLWVIPPERMTAKGGKGRRREHKVPLSDAAVTLLRQMAGIRNSNFVFPSVDGGALSNVAFRMLLRRMGRADLTTHGFRSTFRTWAAECTDCPREVAEMALAHTVGDATEQAYQRGDLFEKRRKLMSDWADYCARPLARVLDFSKKRRGAVQ